MGMAGEDQSDNPPRHLSKKAAHSLSGVARAVLAVKQFRRLATDADISK